MQKFQTCPEFNDTKKIFIVEDEEQYREILAKKLTSEGFDVLTAEDGEKALEIIRDNQIDLILLDLIMPKMDGIQFASRLRSQMKDIPIIILSNLTRSAYPSNIKDYLVKANTSIDEVVSKVKSNLEE